MKRGQVLALFGAIVLVLVITSVAKHLRIDLLAPSALALKPVHAPARFADDCSKLRRAVANSKVRNISRSVEGLTADEQAIYRVILQQRSGEGVLNVSSRTFPLDTTNDISDCDCITGIEAEALVRAAHSYHKLTADLLTDLRARLVSADIQADLVRINDPGNPKNRSKSVKDAVDDAFATGLLSVSEIAFDKGHTHALVSYRFWCGALCGSGATYLFEKVDGEWKKSAQTCGGWIS